MTASAPRLRAASTASGATFLGTPALGYEWGLAAQWSNFLYPIGLNFGVLICMRLIATSGNRFGNRSIPEYLGDRYRSEGIERDLRQTLVVLFAGFRFVDGGGTVTDEEQAIYLWTPRRFTDSHSSSRRGAWPRNNHRLYNRANPDFAFLLA